MHISRLLIGVVIAVLLRGNAIAGTLEDCTKGDEVCRLQLSQWQYPASIGAPRYSNRMSPQRQRPVVALASSSPIVSSRAAKMNS